MQVGEDEDLDRITADILEQNQAMQRVCEKLGFDLVRGDEVGSDMVKAVKRLSK